MGPRSEKISIPLKGDSLRKQMVYRIFNTDLDLKWFDNWLEDRSEAAKVKLYM